jgi:hypothetical protein
MMKGMAVSGFGIRKTEEKISAWSKRSVTIVLRHVEFAVIIIRRMNLKMKQER